MRFVEADLVIVTYGAADVFLAFFPSVPFRLAGPVDLARLAAVYLALAHNKLSLNPKIQHSTGIVNGFCLSRTDVLCN